MFTSFSEKKLIDIKVELFDPTMSICNRYLMSMSKITKIHDSIFDRKNETLYQEFEGICRTFLKEF